MHIAVHGVGKGFIYPVKCFVVAVKGGVNRHVGVNNLNTKGCSVACNLKVAEAEPREICLGKAWCAVGDSCKRLIVVVLLINGAILSQFLRKAHGDFFTLGGIYLK